MKSIVDLSQTAMISFEINKDCNLKHIHKNCPINYRKIDQSSLTLTTDKIVQSILEAKKLNFKGYIAFHNYNEPLLSKNEILNIIHRVPTSKYLLWTNGLLLNRSKMSENDFLKKFDKICITVYNKKDKDFFQEISERYHGVKILEYELDDRKDAYTRQHKNLVNCRRPILDIPIDYYGNVHLCYADWNNTFKIGNIMSTSLYEVITGDIYQGLVKNSKRKLLDRTTCPEICKRCNCPWIYSQYYKMYYEE